MDYSKDGYKRNSKDVNKPYNLIPSGDITMKGVDFPVMGTDNLGNQQLMQPGFDYQFPGSEVFEQPMQNTTQDKSKNQVKKRKVDRDNKLITNWTPEMGDVSSHLMSTMQFTDDDGSPIYVAIPTLFPTVEGQETPDPSTWTQFANGDMKAFEMAMDRGEVYYFNSAEEANEFANGSWKTPNLKKRDGGSLPKAQFGLVKGALSVADKIRKADKAKLLQPRVYIPKGFTHPSISRKTYDGLMNSGNTYGHIPTTQRNLLQSIVFSGEDITGAVINKIYPFGLFHGSPHTFNEPAIGNISKMLKSQKEYSDKVNTPGFYATADPDYAATYTTWLPDPKSGKISNEPSTSFWPPSQSHLSRSDAREALVNQAYDLGTNTQLYEFRLADDAKIKTVTGSDISSMDIKDRKKYIKEGYDAILGRGGMGHNSEFIILNEKKIEGFNKMSSSDYNIQEWARSRPTSLRSHDNYAISQEGNILGMIPDNVMNWAKHADYVKYQQKHMPHLSLQEDYSKLSVIPPSFTGVKEIDDMFSKENINKYLREGNVTNIKSWGDDDYIYKRDGGSLPKAQDGFGNIEAEEEAKDYMTNYLYSDLFKRRVEDVHGEENYDAVYRAKMDALNDVTMNATDPERWKYIFDNPVTNFNFQKNWDESKKLQATYRGKNNEITYNTEQALDAMDNLGLSYNPLSSMIVNEYTHALGATGSNKYFPFPMTEKEKELAQKRKKGSNPNDHDRREHEIKSDIETTRFELYNNDLYDLFDKNFKFDKSHIDFMKDNPNKFIKDVNLFDIYEDDVILEMMNTFTDNSSMPPGMSKYGGDLPKAQFGISKLVNALGKTNKYKSILPKPTVSTIPFSTMYPTPKFLPFDQTGQVIPQQHMVNINRGSAGLNEAINDIMSGTPMWFAPTGDTRYLDRSSTRQLNPDFSINKKGNAVMDDFVSGLGQPITFANHGILGNTGKKGINEYPMTEAEKEYLMNKGYHNKTVTDKDGNLIFVPDYANPILRQERIYMPGHQGKIEGVFAPDIKFKIFDDTELSKQGHAMHIAWKPEDFQPIIDEGYDAIQLTRQGKQLENILLNPDKFKFTHINEMPVTYEIPPFQVGGTLPKAQFGLGRGTKKAFNYLKNINPLGNNSKIAKELSKTLDAASLRNSAIKVNKKIIPFENTNINKDLFLSSEHFAKSYANEQFVKQSDILKSDIPLTRTVDSEGLIIKDGKLFDSKQPHKYEDDYTLDRNTTHWGYGLIESTGGSSIAGRSTAIISDFKSLKESGVPMDLHPTDTYFYSKGNFEIPNNSLILTKDKKLYNQIKKETNIKAKLIEDVSNKEFADIVNSYGKSKRENGVRVFEDYIKKNFDQGLDAAHWKQVGNYNSLPLAEQEQRIMNFGFGERLDPNINSYSMAQKSAMHEYDPLSKMEESRNLGMGVGGGYMHRDYTQKLAGMDTRIQISEMDKILNISPDKSIARDLQKELAELNGFKSYKEFKESVDMTDFKRDGGQLEGSLPKAQFKMLKDAYNKIKSPFVDDLIQQPNRLYRGIGKAGYKDALNTGQIKSNKLKVNNQFAAKSGAYDLTKNFGNKTFFTPTVNTAGRYGEGYVAEINNDAHNFSNRYNSDWSQFTTDPIFLNEANIYKKNMLGNYKKILSQDKVGDYSKINFLDNVKLRVNKDVQSGLNYYKNFHGRLRTIDPDNLLNSVSKMGDHGTTSLYRYGDSPFNASGLGNSFSSQPKSGWFSADPMDPFRYQDYRGFGKNVFKIDVENQLLNDVYRGGPQQGSTGFKSGTTFKEFDVPDWLISLSNKKNLGNMSDYKKYLNTVKQSGGSLTKHQVPKYVNGVLQTGKAATSTAQKFKNFFSINSKNPATTEINWATVNPEILDNVNLMKEYVKIEEETKANSRWMKNDDGSAFWGTPAQFIQQQSQNFMNAYPNGFKKTFRGESGVLKLSSPDYVGQPDKSSGNLGVFTGSEELAKRYTDDLRLGSNSSLLELAIPITTDGSKYLNLNGLGNDWTDLHSIGTTKKTLELNIKNLENNIRKAEEGFQWGNDIGFKNVIKYDSYDPVQHLRSYKDFYNNYDEIVNNPIYQNLVQYKNKIKIENKSKYKSGLRAGMFSTDNVGDWLETSGLNNVAIKYLDDGGWGNLLLNNQVPGNYLKSLTNNNGMFDLNNPKILKQEGGPLDKAQWWNPKNAYGAAKSLFQAPTAKSKLLIPSRSYSSVAPKISSLKQQINKNYPGQTGFRAFFPEPDYGKIFEGMNTRVGTFIEPGTYGLNEPIKLMDGNTRFWLGEQKGKNWDSWYRDWQSKNQSMFPEIAEKNLILNREKQIWEPSLVPKPKVNPTWATEIPNFLPKNYLTDPLVKQSYIESGAYSAKNQSLLSDQIEYGSSLDKSGFDASTLIDQNISLSDAGLNSNRTVVQFPMPDGKTQFMMRSSGNANKDFRGLGSSEGIWSPFPGFHTTLNGGKPVDNWFVKGTQNQYDNFYGSKSYEDISKKLSELEITNQWDMSNQGFKSLRTKNNPNGLPSQATPAELKIFKETPGNEGLNIGGGKTDGNLIDTQQQGGQPLIKAQFFGETKEDVDWTGTTQGEIIDNEPNLDLLKQGVSYAESLSGELMINPESTATGLYGQRFSEVKKGKLYDGTRNEFALDLDAQNSMFEQRYNGELKDIPGLKQSGIDLYEEYNNQITDFPYSTTEIAALVNFLGRKGTRDYLGYVLRDGNTLESVFPTKYGSKANQANKTPNEYIIKFNKGLDMKMKGGEIDKLTERLIKKYEEGGTLTPEGIKHLKSLGMI